MIKQSPAYLLRDILPDDLIYVIHTYLPRTVKKKKGLVSPSLQKELTKLQSIVLKGKIGMYMRDLDDFCLD
jgi:hypothetical protein